MLLAVVVLIIIILIAKLPNKSKTKDGAAWVDEIEEMEAIIEEEEEQ